MKKLLALFSLAILCLPLSAAAADFHSGKRYLLGKDQTVAGDLYAAGNSVTLEGAIAGDVTTLGNTIVFSGTASEDLQVAGGALTLAGNVGDDLRAAGGAINFSGSVKSDALIAGGDITISPSALVAGDTFVAGGTVFLSGTFQGAVRIYAREVTIDGAIKGPVYISADSVTFGSHAVLEATTTYRSASEAVMLGGAQLKGTVTHDSIAPRESPSSPVYWAKVIGFWFVLKLLMIFLGCLVMSLYYQRAVKGLAKRFFDGFGWNVLIGFAFLVAVPVGATLLMLSVVGILVGVLVLLVYGAMLIINTLYLPALIGGEIYRYFRRESEMKVSVLTIVIGTVALAVLALIPFIGWAVAFVLMLGTLGAGIRFKWSELQSYR